MRGSALSLGTCGVSELKVVTSGRPDFPVKYGLGIVWSACRLSSIGLCWECGGTFAYSAEMSAITHPTVSETLELQHKIVK